MQQHVKETVRLEVIGVASKPREKMPIEDRAKQFMPFAALKGLPEALAKVEEELNQTETGYDDTYGAWRETDNGSGQIPQK